MLYLRKENNRKEKSPLNSYNISSRLKLNKDMFWLFTMGKAMYKTKSCETTHNGLFFVE